MTPHTLTDLGRTCLGLALAAILGIGLLAPRDAAAAGEATSPQTRLVTSPVASPASGPAISHPPTSRPPACSSTGRLMSEGCACMSAAALLPSRSALSSAGKPRKVVPALLSSASQPTASIQRRSRAGRWE